MYRDILVHMDGHAAARNRLQFSIDLARRTGARLTGLHVRPPVDVEPVLLAQLDEAVEQRAANLETQARAAAEAFDSELGQSAEASWLSLDGDVVDGVCRCAAFADLVIIGQYEQQPPAQRHPLPVAHSIILHSGRPVLVVPPEHACVLLRRVAISWDRTREAVRAVHDAMPLLLSADSIDIVATKAVDGDSAAALAQHLSNHGCSPLPKVVLPKPQGESEHALWDIILSGDHNLLVMGGSSHPTWHEFLFGGVTRSILMESKIPVLAAA
jgi:nucleotide-binding universal stress UspA family protein